MASKKIGKWLDIIETRIIAALCKCLVLIGLSISVIEICKRFLFGSGFAWGEEVITYTVLFGTILYFGISQKEGSHLRVTVFIDKLGPVGAAVTDLFMVAMGLLYFFLVVRYLVPTIRILQEKGAISYSAKIPLSFIYTVFGVAILLFAFRLVEKSLKTLRDLKNLRN